MSDILPDTAEDFNAFTSVAPDLKKSQPPRQLEEELFNKNWQKNVIDKYERSLGIPSLSTKKAAENVVVKNKTFKMEYTEDANLLNELMNSPKYNIIYWKDNWTVDGHYRIFCIYKDNLDFTVEKK